AQANSLCALSLLPCLTAIGKSLMTRPTASQPNNSVNGLLRGFKIDSKAWQNTPNPVAAVTAPGTESINWGSTIAARGIKWSLKSTDLSRELVLVTAATGVPCDPDPAFVPTAPTGSIRAVGRCLKST